MRQGGVEEAVDVHVVLDQLVVALVVFSSANLLASSFLCSVVATHIGFFMGPSSSSLL